MTSLEERVAALEAIVAMLTHKLLQSGDITINDARAAHGLPPFREPWADSPGYGQVVTGPEPDFMAQTRTEEFYGPILTVRLTHEPTGVTVVARDRTEGVYKLRKALAARARREYDLQEAERRRQRKAATA